MEWEGRRESGNVEDRRSLGGKALMVGGGGSILLVILALLFGVDPRALMQQQQQQAAPQEGQAPADDKASRFAKVVLADTEDVWNDLFQQMGRKYKEPKLVLFTGRVQSACGLASAAVGPFYCPGDHNVYLDLAFFDELSSRFGAKGDFAQAYVIAHEVGHHVQNLLGQTARVDAARGRVSESEMNRLSVRLELQADFLAGVWAHHGQKTKRFLEPGDIEEAMRCATAIGDDRLQREAQGYVRPDSFTHGTSEQRVRWFRKGFASGRIEDGDTFSVRYEDL
jgi:predicted metalloprotease